MKKVFNKLKEVTRDLGGAKSSIIIVGGTEVSIQLAAKLSSLGQEVIIIEADDYLCKQLQERLDCLVVQGLVTEAKTRQKVKLNKASILIAVAEDDQYNLLAGLYAQQLGVEQVIVQITSENLYDKQIQEEKFDLDLVINPFAMAVKRIKSLVNSGTVLELQQMLDSKVKINKFKISHQNRLAYQEVNKLNLAPDALLIIVVRKGRALIPQTAEKIYPGDLLYVIARRGIKTKLSTLIQSPTPKEKLILGGASAINQKLARFFSKQAIVTIITESRTQGQKLAEELDDVLVLEGSSFDLELLNEEGIAQTDVFVAGTTKQRKNLLAVTLAQKLGCKKTIAIVDEIYYSNLDDYLELDYIICPSLLAIDTILDYLHQGQVTEDSILGGQIKTFKLTFKQQQRSSVGHLNLPADILIALIWRGDEVIIPQQDTKLFPQDEMLILTVLSLAEVKNHLYKV